MRTWMFYCICEWHIFEWRWFVFLFLLVERFCLWQRKRNGIIDKTKRWSVEDNRTSHARNRRVRKKIFQTGYWMSSPWSSQVFYWILCSSPDLWVQGWRQHYFVGSSVNTKTTAMFVSLRLILYRTLLSNQKKTIKKWREHLTLWLRHILSSSPLVRVFKLSWVNAIVDWYTLKKKGDVFNLEM